MKILVIDDEKPTLSMFQLFLSAYGYEVLTAESGEEGLEIFEKENPPIVLTDIKMPGMDGLAVLKAIKQKNSLTEVIVITGHGDMDIALEALNLNATDFINKPINKDALDVALKRAEERLRLARSEDEDISVKKQNNTVIMVVKGNITSRSEPFLVEAFEKAKQLDPKKLLLSFDENTSINGAGIAVLIQILSECKKKDLHVVISGLSENFRKVFDMVGITRMAEIYDTEEDALAAG